MKVAGLWFVLLLAAASVAQTSSDGGWTRFSSEGGKFSALFPGAPEQNSTTEKGVVLHTVTLVDRPRVYMVLYSDYPEADGKLETTQRLNAERDGFLKGTTEGKLVAERQFKFKRGSTELPALEFTSETPTVTYKSVVVLDGTRVYFFCAGAVKGNDSTVQFERFLGSFQLQ
jgi:hypothetical protein